jgi:hypothetical protein
MHDGRRPMTDVIRIGDCGNSPKNLLVESLSIALATGDIGGVGAALADNVHWRVVGNEPVAGVGALADALRIGGKRTPKRVVIGHVMTHGRAGAVSGTVEFAGGRQREFCDVFEFSSAKGTHVSRITSYRVEP